MAWRMRWCSMSEACWRSATMFRVSDWKARAPRMSATTLAKTLLPLARAMAAWKLESRADPGFGIVFGGHGGHDVPQALQFLVGAALRGQPGCRNLDVGAGFGEVPGGVGAQDEVLGHLVGDHERAFAGFRDGQAECGAGAQGLADHRAADPVPLRERGFGTELRAHRHLPDSMSVRRALKTASAALRRGSGWAFARTIWQAVLLSGCLTGSRFKYGTGHTACQSGCQLARTLVGSARGDEAGHHPRASPTGRHSRGSVDPLPGLHSHRGKGIKGGAAGPGPWGYVGADQRSGLKCRQGGSGRCPWKKGRRC